MEADEDEIDPRHRQDDFTMQDDALVEKRVEHFEDRSLQGILEDRGPGWASHCQFAPADGWTTKE